MGAALRACVVSSGKRIQIKTENSGSTPGGESLPFLNPVTCGNVAGQRELGSRALMAALLFRLIADAKADPAARIPFVPIQNAESTNRVGRFRAVRIFDEFTCHNQS